MIFFTGIVYVDSQDEGIYLTSAHSLINGYFTLNNYANYNSSHIANPAEAFKFRPMVFYPPFLFFTIFGITNLTAVLFSIICSLLLIVVIFELGKFLVNEKVGLLSAFLIVIFPLNIIYSTRLMPEAALSLFFALSVLFFLKAAKTSGKIIMSKDKLFYFLTGLSIGLGYLTKITIFLVIPIILLITITQKKFSRKYIFIVLGFLLILIPEGLYYYSVSGDFFLNLDISTSVYKHKYMYENVQHLDFNIFRLSYTDSAPLYYLPTMTGLITHKTNLNYLGLFYWFFIASIIFAFWKKMPNRNILLIWTAVLFLYLEFGNVGITFINGHINYMLISKHEHYLAILTAPLTIFLGFMLSRIKKPLFITIVTVLSLTSLILVNNNIEFLRSGVKAIENAADFLEPDKPIYTDYMAAGMLAFNYGFKKDHLIKLFPENQTIKDAYVITGGSRGMDISCKYIEELKPDYFANASKSWNIVKIIENPARKYSPDCQDITIYYVN
jgi:hypothetical protein